MREQSREIDHARFGTVAFDPETVIEFPGLPGFPTARRFVVREHDQGSAFAWLISCEVRDLAFVVANPWDYVPDYAPHFATRYLRAIEHEDGDELLIIAIATCSGGSVWLNLAAPLLINMRSLKGMQTILEGAGYSTRELIVEGAS